jgi:hypothetical protein
MYSQPQHWSPSEKKIARRAFDAALALALGKVFAEFKRKAAAVSTNDAMWEIEDFLREQRKTINETFDYRYSVLLLVFAGLIRDGLLQQEQLAGLAEDKLQVVRRYLEFAKGTEP